MYAEAVIKNQNALSLSPNTFLMFKMDKHTFLHLTKSKYIFFLFFFLQSKCKGHADNHTVQ